MRRLSFAFPVLTVMWYRVFGLTDVEVQPAGLQEHLRRAGMEVLLHVRGDETGWFEAEMVFDSQALRASGRKGDCPLDSGGQSPLLPDALMINRYLATEEGVRAELNSWAAWVEQQADNPRRDVLMRQFIAVRQMFTAEVPETLATLGLEACRYLAAQTGGYYQVDGQGLFAPDGTLVVPE